MLSFLVYSCYVGNTVPSETFRCLLEDSITSGLHVTAVAAAIAGMCDGTTCSALPVGHYGDQLKSTPRQVFEFLEACLPVRPRFFLCFWWFHVSLWAVLGRCRKRILEVRVILGYRVRGQPESCDSLPKNTFKKTRRGFSGSLGALLEEQNAILSTHGRWLKTAVLPC